MIEKLLKRSFATLITSICLTMGSFTISAQNSVVFTGTLPSTSIGVGSPQTISLQYESNVVGKIKFALERRTSTGGYYNDGEIIAAYVDTQITAAPISVNNVTVTVPAGTPLSSTLTNGDKYMWTLTEMSLPNYDFLSGSSSDVVVIAANAPPVVTNSMDWTTPTPVATIKTGGTQTINLHYTADILGKGKAALVRTTSTGGYISNAEIAVSYFDTEPTTITPVEKSFVLTIPAETPLSNVLENGEKYMWNITQMTTSYGFISQKQLDVEVIEETAVKNSLDWTTTPVAIITTGATETINLHYTADVLGKGKAALVRTTSTGGYISGAEIAVQYFDTDPTTTTPVEKSFVLTIPAETPLSNTLENGEKYMWNITQMTTSYGFISQKQSDVIVTDHLKVSGFEKELASKLITKNPVSNTLTLNSTVEFSSVSIYDISGKKVAKSSKEKTTDGLDVSNLQKGIYFIVTDTNLKAKFIKE